MPRPSVILSFILICSLNSYAFASRNFQITCDQNVEALSEQFVANWAKTPMPWYASWAQDMMDDYFFVGGMRTIDDKYPSDTNPHLSFLNPEVVYDEERGEVIMCRYKINNPELMDIDNNLEMRTFIFLPENSCYVSSSDTITCDSAG